MCKKLTILFSFICALCLLQTSAVDADLVHEAVDEGRTILTRDRALS